MISRLTAQRTEQLHLGILGDVPWPLRYEPMLAFGEIDSHFHRSVSKPLFGDALRENAGFPHMIDILVLRDIHRSAHHSTCFSRAVPAWRNAAIRMLHISDLLGVEVSGKDLHGLLAGGRRS